MWHIGTSNISGVNGQNDHWMAIDLVALRHLIRARGEHSEWLCGIPIRTNSCFFLGDPARDRIVFNPPPFETVFLGQPRSLAFKYLFAINKAASLLSARDTLVIVLVGHGDADDHHSFFIGDNPDSCYRLGRNDLEEAVRGTKGDILLISTACFSGSWKSRYWTLLAAAGPDLESTSIVESASNEYRSGFFINSLLAEYADEFKIRPPFLGLVDEVGRRAPEPTPRMPRALPCLGVACEPRA